MLTVISPAKKLDYDSELKIKTYTTPDYLEDSQLLIKRMRDFSTLDISELMHVSSKIAELNFDRYEAWNADFTPDNARQAIFAFKGDVYTGLDAESLKKPELNYAQKHLRILSGLYGLLRPLDLMKAYRLEMGTRLKNSRGKDLYEFWGMNITEGINAQLKQIKSKVLVNLASNEYFKSVKPKAVQGEVITPAFKEYKNGDYKMIGIYAKRARGLMSRFIIQNRINDVADLKSFDLGGYRLNKKLSKDNNPVFTRRQA